MTDIHRTEIDGVPVFWTDAPAQPFAALLFRVGRGDEPFALAGMTHIVEHLVFGQLGDRPFPVNGMVDHVTTVFHAAGRVEENCRFLEDVVGALGALEADRLPQELRVLRVEAAQRGPSVINAQFTYRYGTETLGRAAVDEHALHRATQDDVAAWVHRWFTRGNAVAWLSFPPPAGFRLPLPDGERMPVGERRNIEPLPLPSFGLAPVGGVSLAGPLRRTSAGAAGTRVLRTRMERRLRRDLGLSYEVSDAYLPLDADTAFVSLYASCQDDAAEQVAGEVLGLADELAADGPTAAELADDVDGFERQEEDPSAVLGDLARVADNALLGHPVASSTELLAELRATTPAQVQAAMATFTAELIGLGPRLPELPGRWLPYPMWSQRAVQGRRFESVAKRFPWSKGTPAVVLADDGVSLLAPDGLPVTVWFDRCAGVTRPADDVRVVFGTDGFQVVVAAQEWRDGAALVAGIDRAWAPERQVVLVS